MALPVLYLSTWVWPVLTNIAVFEAPLLDLALPLICPPAAAAQTAVAARKRRTEDSSTTNELEKSAAHAQRRRAGEGEERGTEEAMSHRESRSRLQWEVELGLGRSTFDRNQESGTINQPNQTCITF